MALLSIIVILRLLAALHEFCSIFDTYHVYFEGPAY